MRKILISTASFLCLSLMLAAAETPTGVPPLVSHGQVSRHSFISRAAARRDARIANRQATLDSSKIENRGEEPKTRVRSRKVERTLKYRTVR